MHGLLRAAFCATLLCPSLPLFASTVLRCEDANGHVTFTLQGCPSEHSQQLQNAYNPTPGKGKPVPLAKKSKSSRSSKVDKVQKTTELVVVGGQQDGCGNRLTGSARRTAIIKEQIRAGMTQADVESALGKPDKVSSHNGLTRYHYRNEEGTRSRQVSFDEHGCVKGK